MGPQVLIAAAADPFIECLRRHLPAAAAVSISASEAFPAASFTIGSNGALVESAIVVDKRCFDFRQFSGVIFRPGRGWHDGRARATLRQAFNRHERRAAWIALLAALPCPVANRLTPEWLLAPELHECALAKSFAASVGLRATRATDRFRGRPGRGYFVGSAFVSSDSSLEATLGPSLGERLEAWCRATGILYGSLECRRTADGYEVERVRPVPSFERERRDTIHRVCRLLAARLHDPRHR